MYYILEALLALSVILPVMSAVTVALRFYARHVRGLSWLADDWLVVVALVSFPKWFYFADSQSKLLAKREN
jgi:hypothetical protein